MRIQPAMLVLVTMVSLFVGPAAEIGIITSAANVNLPGGSTGSVGPIGANPTPNNDNARAASANAIPYSIFFDSPGMDIRLTQRWLLATRLDTSSWTAAWLAPRGAREAAHRARMKAQRLSLRALWIGLSKAYIQLARIHGGEIRAGQFGRDHGVLRPTS